jgi:hypothetical protein
MKRSETFSFLNFSLSKYLHPHFDSSSSLSSPSSSSHFSFSPGIQENEARETVGTLFPFLHNDSNLSPSDLSSLSSDGQLGLLFSQQSKKHSSLLSLSHVDDEAEYESELVLHSLTNSYSPARMRVIPTTPSKQFSDLEILSTISYKFDRGSALTSSFFLFSPSSPSSSLSTTNSSSSSSFHLTPEDYRRNTPLAGNHHKCPICGCSSPPFHPSCCQHNMAPRTMRHHQIKRQLASFSSSIPGMKVQAEDWDDVFDVEERERDETGERVESKAPDFSIDIFISSSTIFSEERELHLIRPDPCNISFKVDVTIREVCSSSHRREILKVGTADSAEEERERKDKE